MFERLLKTSDYPYIIIIRIMVGTVFLSEGLQKFILPLERGAGRFEKLGVFAPQTTGPAIGIVELICGAFVVAGLMTRFASFVLMVIMAFAIYYSQLPVLEEKGFLEMANKIRTDWSMMTANLFLLLAGGGKWSLDKKIYSS